jgi:hypothetical protein
MNVMKVMKDMKKSILFQSIFSKRAFFFMTFMLFMSSF